MILVLEAIDFLGLTSTNHKLLLGFGSVLGLGCGMFVWLVMIVCVDYFLGISYATIGLENQVVFACF